MKLKYNKFSIVLNIGFPLIMFVTIAILTTNFLNQSKFEKTLRQLETERYFYIANDLKNSIETALDWGLSLDSLENIPPLMKEVINENQEIDRIAVVKGSSDVVFQSSNNSIDLSTSQNQKNDNLHLSVLIKNASNQEVGKIEIQWSKQVKQGIINKVLGQLNYATWITIILNLLLGVFGIYFLLARFNNRLAQFQNTLLINLDKTPSNNVDINIPELAKDNGDVKSYIGQYLYGVVDLDIDKLIKNVFNRLYILQDLIHINKPNTKNDDEQF